jgi:hypothetical protein
MGLKDLFGMSTKHTGQHQVGKHTAQGQTARKPKVKKTSTGKKGK